MIDARLISNFLLSFCPSHTFYFRTFSHIHTHTLFLSPRKTADLKPRAGRSSYIDPKQAKGVIDPGAAAAAGWLTALFEALAEAFKTA